jgi:hypothetical protein
LAFVAYSSNSNGVIILRNNYRELARYKLNESGGRLLYVERRP